MYKVAYKTIPAPCPSIFNGSISSRGALIKQFINKMVIVFYVFNGKYLVSF